MARKGAEYTDEQLAEMYRKYAQLKGWSTKASVIRGNISTWRSSSIGPIGLAIDFFENGEDNAKHLGYDAEARSSNVPVMHIVTTIVGTEYSNPNGTSRQSILQQCQSSEFLLLKHEPKNRFDKNAVAVLRHNGQQLGYLPRKLAAEVVAQSNRGWKYFVHLSSVTTSNKIIVQLGSEDTTTPIDAKIVLFILRPDATEKEWQDYYKSWVISQTVVEAEIADEPNPTVNVAKKTKEKGICEGCGNSPRVLSRIESGQMVCQTCLREIRG